MRLLSIPFVVAVYTLAMSVAYATTAAAQRAQAFAQLEAGFGYGAGGNEYVDREGFSVEFLVGRASPAPSRREFTMFLGAQGLPGTADSCLRNVANEPSRNMNT